MSTVHRRRKSQAASFCRTNLRECLSCITAGSTNTQPRPKRSISWSAFEVNSQAWLRRDWRLSFSRKERMGQGTERALLELLSYRTSLHTHLQSVWYSPTWMVQQGTALAEKKLQKNNQPANQKTQHLSVLLPHLSAEWRAACWDTPSECSGQQEKEMCRVHIARKTTDSSGQVHNVLHKHILHFIR